MKTLNIKGKEYVTVNERLKYFRSQAEYKGWRIVEDIATIDDKEGIFRVTILDDAGQEMAVAHSQEYRDSSNINKTSFLENGFTSALGRALGYLGIGIDTSIASAQEVSNAVAQQEADQRPWLTEAQYNATLNGTADQAKIVLSKFKAKKEFTVGIKQRFGL